MVSTTLQDHTQEAYPGLRTLTIVRKWFDKICAGEKTVEYREYSKRIETVSHAPYFKLVNGYRADSAFPSSRSKRAHQAAAATAAAADLFPPAQRAQGGVEPPEGAGSIRLI